MRAAVALLLLYILHLDSRDAAATNISHSRHRSLHSRAAVAGYSSSSNRHWPQKQQHKHPRESQAVVSKQCASGCEQNGNCNRALGFCECPVGYIGPDCSTPLWPGCKVAPQQLELYCTNDWYPKSCACLQQCAAFVCPDGTHASCERDFDLFNSKCFLRTSNVSTTEDGVVWDGGSEFPEDTEEGVKYYKGYLHKEVTQEITRQVAAAAVMQ